MKLKNLFEQDNMKTKTKTTDKIDQLINDMNFSKDKPLSKPVEKNEDPKSKPKANLNVASKEKTHAKMSNVKMSPKAIHQLGAIINSGLQSKVSDEEALKTAGFDITKPILPTTLPAVINKSISNLYDVEPEWHQVKHLPGYMSNAIRAMGERIFDKFTSTPISNIQVIASLHGSGPNSPAELNRTTSWLHKFAEPSQVTKIDFEKIIPGYHANVVVYHIADFAFMLVQDEHGHYIYSWPDKDSKSPSFRTKRVETFKKFLGKE